MKLLKSKILIFTLFFWLLLVACSQNNENETIENPAVTATFGTKIDLKNLSNYANQTIPNYITKNNTGSNAITDAGATLGRILFYDKKLSSNNNISCASCHKQNLAFGDDALASVGVNGTTGRHSMRLVNARFANEVRFFWDERATSLENQTTQPIQDHKEMGFSGQEGDQNLNDLIIKLEAIDYYKEIFKFVYGDENITETRIQNALSQFIRSIQSFDAKFDVGFAQVNNINQNFPNFTTLENTGKNLFLTPPQFDTNALRTGGGAGCNGCHVAPEFSINPNSLNNGVIGAIGGGTDLTVTRSPTLRDIVKIDGSSNGPFMHTGISNQLMTVINHYNVINTAGNNNLDPRLRPNGQGQNLQLTQNEKDALVAFLRTLSGTNVYTDAKWSDPF